MTITRERAALHEAGHAVISLALRTGVSRVRISRSGDKCSGLTSYRRSNLRDDSRRNVVERRALTTVGGIAAEWLEAGRPNDSPHEPPDVFAALDLICRLDGITDLDESSEAINMRFIDLVERAASLLESRWSQVMAVTSALELESELSRQRLLELVPVAVPRSHRP